MPTMIQYLPDILDPMAVYHLSQRLWLRRNILISGAAGRGKTTVQRALGNMLGPAFRIGVAEDRPEIKLNTATTNSIIARSRLDSSNEAQIADLAQDLIKMRVDWLLMGELRNGEDAGAYLDICTRGTNIIADVHAPDPEVALKRLCSLGALFETYELSLARAVSGIGTLVHVERLPKSSWQTRALVSIYDIEEQGTTQSGLGFELKPVYLDPRLNNA